MNKQLKNGAKAFVRINNITGELPCVVVGNHSEDSFARQSANAIEGEEVYEVRYTNAGRISGQYAFVPARSLTVH